MADEDEPDLLLHGSADSGSDTNMLLIGALAAAGVGLLLYNRKKKKEEDEEKKSSKESSKKLPEAGANQVVFAQDFSDYEIGSAWFESTLDPYLEDMIENSTLATPEWKEKGPLGWAVTDENIETMMNETRNKVLGAFNISHFVSVGESQKTIAALPDNKVTRHFKGMIDAHTREFQEAY